MKCGYVSSFMDSLREWAEKNVMLCDDDDVAEFNFTVISLKKEKLSSLCNRYTKERF